MCKQLFLTFFFFFFFCTEFIQKTHANLQVICILWLTAFSPSPFKSPAKQTNKTETKQISKTVVSEVTHSYASYAHWSHRPGEFLFIFFFTIFFIFRFSSSHPPNEFFFFFKKKTCIFFFFLLFSQQFLLKTIIPSHVDLYIGVPQTFQDHPQRIFAISRRRECKRREGLVGLGGVFFWRERSLASVVATALAALEEFVRSVTIVRFFFFRFVCLCRGRNLTKSRLDRSERHPPPCFFPLPFFEWRPPVFIWRGRLAEEDVVFKSLGWFQLGDEGVSCSLPAFGCSESSTSTLVAARYTARPQAASRTSAAAS